MSKAKDYIEAYTKKCSNAVEGCNQDAYYSEGLYQPWLTPENALAAIEIERQEVIERAVEWLCTHDSYATPTNVKVEELREYLKKKGKG